MVKHTRIDTELFRLADWDPKERSELILRLVDENFDAQKEAEKLVVWEDIDCYWGEVEKARKDWGQVVGLSSGFWEIDRMIGGFAPGEMTIIGAATGIGKSRFTANIALIQACAGHKVAYASLENAKVWEGLRFENIIGVDAMKWIREHKTLRTLRNKRITQESMRYLVKKAKEWGAEIVYLDHLHFLGRDLEDQASGIGVITQELHYLAEEFEVPLVVVSHLRKMEQTQIRPSKDDLRGSSYIGQDADNILMLWRGENKSEVNIAVEKHRNRALWIEGAYCSFRHKGLRMLKNPYDETLDLPWRVDQ